MKFRYLFAVLLFCIPAFGQIALVGGCAAAANTCTPAVIGGGVFATGQFEYTFTYRSALGAPTQVLSNYLAMDTASSGSASFRSFCAVMTSSTPFVSTFTNATNVVTLIYSGVAATTTANCLTNGVGGHSATGNQGNVATITYGSITMTHGNASSWVIGAAGNSAAVCTPSTVLHAEESATDVVGNDTNGTVNSFSSNLNCTATTGNWKVDIVELIAAPVATPTFGTNGGTFGTSASTTLADATGSSTICYTTDGSTPASTISGICSAGSTYSTGVTVTVNGAVVNALGTKAGFSNSAVATSSTFTINKFLSSLGTLGISGPGPCNVGACGNTWTTSTGWSATGATSSTGVACTPACPAVTVPTTVAGDLIYVQVVSSTNAFTISSGSAGAGTWVIPANCVSSGGTGELACAYVLSATGGVTTITITMSGSITATISIRSYHPSSTTAVAETVPAANSSAGCSNNCTTPSVTLTGTSDLIVAAISAGDTGCSVASPYGNFTAPSGDGIADQFNATSGTGATFTQGTSCPTAASAAAGMTTVAFK
jgi:hypothetical protein